jgi:hypothetical protein
MIGDDSPVNGPSGPSSGDEIIGCSLRATDRPFPTIRYFSDACRDAIDYSSPVRIGYELMPPILYLPQTDRTGAILTPNFQSRLRKVPPAFRATQCALE